MAADHGSVAEGHAAVVPPAWGMGPGTAARARRAWPLRLYLLSLLVMFVATAAAATVSGWSQSEGDALSAARLDATHAAGLAAREIGENLATLRATVDGLAASPGVKQVYRDPRLCQLSFGLRGGPEAGHLDLLGADGTIVCSSRQSTGADARSYAGAPWLSAGSGASQLVGPVLDARTGRQAAVVTATVPGLGMVAAFVDLAALGATVGALFAGARQLEFLVGTEDGGTVLTRSLDGRRWAGTRLPASRFTAPNRAGDGRDVTGLRRVYGQATVDGAGWRVYAGAARAPALAAAHRLAWRQALVAVVGLSVGLLATLLVYRRIARPVSQLRAAAASGVVPAAVTVPAPREVVALGAEFSRLFHVVNRELAERQRAEETAREHERNYRQMFDCSPYPIYLFDAETLTIVEANEVAVAYYGYPRSTLLGMRVTDLCPPEDVAALTEAINAADAVEQRRQQRQVKHDGTVAEVSVTSYLVSFARRKVRCAIIEDVTEREHLERRLRQSQRLESLGQLAGGIAHDFNNLLGIIIGYASMSAADVEAAARADPAWRALHDDLQQIVAAGDRAALLTRQLLAFARADAVAEPRVLDLNAVVADMDKLLRRTLGEDIQLLTDLGDDGWPVKADPGQLEQVLVNLAVNARDAMPSGGTLTIDAGPATVDEHYAAQHPGLRVGRYMRLRVSDTGTGMSRATLERAFEPFFTTKPKGYGTGLGLATIFGIITQAGGHVQIYSEPGHGTVVTALLPASDETPDTAPPPPAGDHRGHGETVLLVEDDDNLRELTERILLRHGYAVLAAATPAEAERLAAAHPDIDLLLTDVVMPGMDGHTLALVLQASHPRMSVIYMSGYAEPILAARSTLPSGITLLIKPVTAHRLLSAVSRSLQAARRQIRPRRAVGRGATS